MGQQGAELGTGSYFSWRAREILRSTGLWELLLKLFTPECSNGSSLAVTRPSMLKILLVITSLEFWILLDLRSST